MIFWGCFSGYVVAWLFAARYVLYAIRCDDTMAPDGGMETALVGALAFFTGALWPLALPIAIILWHPRKTPAEFRERIEQRDRRIRELERQLGIGQ